MYIITERRLHSYQDQNTLIEQSATSNYFNRTFMAPFPIMKNPGHMFNKFMLWYL